MKRMKKLAALLLAVMMICSMALMGCGAKLDPADQVIGAMYELALRDNATPLKDLLGFESEDDVRASIMEDGGENGLLESVKAQFEAYDVEVTDEELQGMIDSVQSMLAKLTYTAEITEESKDKTTVVLKVNGFSMQEIQDVMLSTQESEMAKLTEEQQMAIAGGDTDALREFVVSFMTEYMKNVAALEPSAETTDITVECEKLKLDVSSKEKVAWLPSDVNKFAQDVENAVFR